MPNTPSSEVVKESLRKAIASVCIGYKKYSPKDRTSEKPVFLDPLSVDLIADELESFLLSAIESARLEGKKELAETIKKMGVTKARNLGDYDMVVTQDELWEALSAAST